MPGKKGKLKAELHLKRCKLLWSNHVFPWLCDHSIPKLTWDLSAASEMTLPVFLPCTVSNCCEGDILLLLDSSGSVLNYEFSRLLLFTAELLRPFSLGQGNVRVGLLQVGTDPHLKFGLNVYSHQDGLQRALQNIRHLQGDTNTVAALRVAKRELIGTKADVPKILLWLTDGVQPGDVDPLMTELKAEGVFVLVVSTVHGDYQVLRRAVTPPLESHLYSVDIEDIDIITDNLREAIISMYVCVCVWLSSPSSIFYLTLPLHLSAPLFVASRPIDRNHSSWTAARGSRNVPQCCAAVASSPEGHRQLLWTQV